MSKRSFGITCRNLISLKRIIFGVFLFWPAKLEFIFVPSVVVLVLPYSRNEINLTTF
jgi:hypothetical protein